MAYSDNKMIYDENLEMYILTEKHILNTLGEDGFTLNAENDAIRSSLAKRVLTQVSLEVYSFIYDHIQEQLLPEWKEKLKEDKYRNILMLALEQQTLYVIRNGALETYSGINLHDSTKLEITKKDTISSLTRSVLMNAGLLYTGNKIWGC